MKSAIIVIDMLKDSIYKNPSSPMAKEASRIVTKIQKLITLGRKQKFPVIFACDSFRADDFIFEEGWKPHSIEGTKNAQLIDELNPLEGDIILKKRRLSAFFRTDLDLSLKRMGVETIILCGISTQFCILATAFDGISSDFRVILTKDCCACHRADFHSKLIEIYEHTVLFPLFKVSSLDELGQEIENAD